MSPFDLISVDNLEAWKLALSHCGAHDIYHLPEYHALSMTMGEGTPYLFHFHDRGNYAALPILLRPLSEVEGLEDSRYFDISSAYGYPGIVTSMKEDAPEAAGFRTGFQASLLEALRQASIIAFFTRTNPFFKTSWLFEGTGEVVPMASTVAIDLSQPETDQIRHMSKGHRCDIRKAYNEGVIVEEDALFEHIDDFIDIYNETMNRVGSTDYYYFPNEYYVRLKKTMGNAVRLFFARLDGKIVSTSMFFTCGDIIQYHLSGTPSDNFQHNGAKAIIDHVRRWGMNRTYSWLHLGGGVGASASSLYRFKAGFSKIRLSFNVVRMIVNQRKYAETTEIRNRWIADHGYHITESNYFPGYRRQYNIDK